MRLHGFSLKSAIIVARENARACGNGADGESIVVVCDAAESLQEENNQMREALKALQTYFEEHLEDCDSPGTQQTLQFHYNICVRALA